MKSQKIYLLSTKLTGEKKDDNKKQKYGKYDNTTS